MEGVVLLICCHIIQQVFLPSTNNYQATTRCQVLRDFRRYEGYKDKLCSLFYLGFAVFLRRQTEKNNKIVQ